jgi:hypothetical protein
VRLGGEIALIAITLAVAPTSSAGDGEPDCATLNPCTRMLEDGSYTAAVQFAMLGAATVSITAEIWGRALDCPEAPDMAMTRSVVLDDGPNTVPIRFFPPLSEGDALAVQWSIGGCLTTPCTTYVIPGTIEEARPPGCF